MAARGLTPHPDPKTSPRRRKGLLWARATTGSGAGRTGVSKPGIRPRRLQGRSGGPRRKLKRRRSGTGRGPKAWTKRDRPSTRVAWPWGPYLDSWLNDSVRGHVRPSTFYRHESIVRLHIRPALGRLKLAALTPAHVQAIYRAKLDEGLSPSASFLIQRRNATPQQPAHLWTSG